MNWAFCFLIVSLIPDVAFGNLVLNEAMVNEPGSANTLEWFEIYNDGGPTSFQFFEIIVNSATLRPQISVATGQYVIVCRDSIEFTTRWPEWSEWSNTLIIEENFTLPNRADSIEIRAIGGARESVLIWPSAGADAVSWERRHPDSANVTASIDVKLATPGFANSVTPIGADLSIDTVFAAPRDGATIASAVITNRGIIDFSNGVLIIAAADSLDSSFVGTQYDVVALPTVPIGFSSLVQRQLIIPGSYQFVQFRLASDARLRNNRRTLVVPGSEFPPFRLNEFIPNPNGALASEWIEIKNVSAQQKDLLGWQFTDATGVAHHITMNSATLAASGYMVLVDSEALFRGFYSQFDDALIEPSGWPTLNNEGDLLKLLDPFGYVADSFNFSAAFPDNFSWSRGETSGRLNSWGRSRQTGGTPGDSNDVVFTIGSDSSIALDVSPRVFAVDDNHDNFVTISISPPAAERYSLKIFDRHGQLVATFLDESPTFQDNYFWYGLHGTGRTGRRVPLGLYLIFFEAHGVESIKQSVVIAQ